ncbi:MAG: hypothetical protein J6L70_03805 [Alphaproteobacteria bacterium]|nr:hypothetical protein [Alphaproteobacteria bacterium]
MSEDEKMFHIGIWALCGVLFLSVGLQVCYRTQNRTRNHVRAEIVRTQQEIADAATRFEGYKRPEVLRNLVGGVVPRAAAIGYQKTVTIDSLPNREIKNTDV